MFQNNFALESITGQNCQELNLVLSSIECKGVENSVIECQEVRMKNSNQFKDFIIDDGDLKICIDN